VLDFADLGTSGWVIPGGASGRTDGPHRTDQLEAWSGNRLLPMRRASRP
jgi:acyl-homoserine lactone acylase PvdQ